MGSRPEGETSSLQPPSPNRTQRESHIERIVEFINQFTARWDPEDPDSSETFFNALVTWLADLTHAKDKAVRFRSCQILAGVLNHMEMDVEVEEAVLARLQEALFDRLRDKIPLVRQFAARGLARLLDPGEDESYEDCHISHR